MRLYSLIRYAVKNNPGKIALIEPKTQKEISYIELNDLINKYSVFFIENNFCGKYIALKYPNSVEWIAMFFALLNIGANPVLIDHTFSAREVIQCMELSHCCNIIISSNDKIFEKIKNSLFVEKIITESAVYNHQNESIYIIDNVKIVDFKNNIKGSKIVLFSYRGVGYPLAVEFNEREIIYSMLNNTYHTGVKSSLIISLILPLSHIFALTTNLLVPLFVGGTIVIISNLKTSIYLSTLEEYSVNFLIAVPTIVKIFLHSLSKSNYNLKNLKKGIIGGNTFDNELKQNWKEATMGGVLSEGYGLTETCPVICNDWSENSENSMGILMRGVEAIIFDDNKKESNIGNLYIKCRSMFDKYLNYESESFFYKDYFNTGDIVSKNKSKFYFVKREKKIAKMSGETVDIEEIKSVLSQYEKKIDFELVLEDDKLLQERVICKIKNKNIDIFVLTDYLRENLALYKIPKILYY